MKARPVALAVVVAFARVATPSVATAGEEKPRAVGLVLGGAIATASIAVGGAMATTRDRSGEHAGMLTAGVGLSLAPVVAHAVGGRTWHGLALAAAPVAGTVALGALYAARSDAISTREATSRGPTVVVYGATIVASIAGVACVLFFPSGSVPQRAAKALTEGLAW